MQGRTYTAEQLRDAEIIAQLLANMPKEKLNIAMMMLNSFISGMEAQENINKEVPRIQK